MVLSNNNLSYFKTNVAFEEPEQYPLAFGSPIAGSVPNEIAHQFSPRKADHLNTVHGKCRDGCADNRFLQ